jgi:septum formation protein
MLVLASASPRRRELLALAGFSFEVRPAEIDESVAPGEEPVGYVTRLAREKAQAVLAALGADNAGVVVLGADTTVIVDGAILGKPVDVEDAKRMLRLLAGRMHRVATGVAVVTARSVEATAEMTTVEFLPMSEEEIAGRSLRDSGSCGALDSTRRGLLLQRDGAAGGARGADAGGGRGAIDFY